MDASPPALNSNEPMGPTVPSTGGVGWGGGVRENLSLGRNTRTCIDIFLNYSFWIPKDNGLCSWRDSRASVILRLSYDFQKCNSSSL